MPMEEGLLIGPTPLHLPFLYCESPPALPVLQQYVALLNSCLIRCLQSAVRYAGDDETNVYPNSPVTTPEPATEEGESERNRVDKMGKHRGSIRGWGVFLPSDPLVCGQNGRWSEEFRVCICTAGWKSEPSLADQGTYINTTLG